MYTLEDYAAMNMKSSTAQMNDRKRESGLRSTQQWIVDVRGTELEFEFNVKHQALRNDIAGLSEHYADKLKSINNLEG
jgi:hypothetical protein